MRYKLFNSLKNKLKKKSNVLNIGVFTSIIFFVMLILSLGSMESTDQKKTVSLRENIKPTIFPVSKKEPTLIPTSKQLQNQIIPISTSIPTPTSMSTSNNNSFMSIISPKEGAGYKFGESISVEIRVLDENKISKIDLAWGKIG